LINKGIRRERSGKRSAAEKILFAGFFLALSTQAISHQDAIFRFHAGIQESDRWQVHVIASAIEDGSGRRVASIVGPEASTTPYQLDTSTTGSTAAGVARGAKADALGSTGRTAYVAGVLGGDDLFAPVRKASAAPEMAFRLPQKPPAPRGTMVASLGASASTPSVPSVSAIPAADDSVIPPVLLAYAPADDASDAPFDAVMGESGKGKVVLDPDIGVKHAWLNSALPKGAYASAQRKCLAEAIYFEARGEPELGRIAVAQVVLNRLKNPAYPNTICSVVYQNKSKRNRCQFSFACDGIPERISDQASWKMARELSDRILDDDRTLFLEDVGAATHYHANYVRPRWARSMKKMDTIGRHIFYKTYNGGWS